MTNFFEHQEKARKRTALLIALFVVAVILIGCAVYAVVAFIWLLQTLDQPHAVSPAFFNAELFATVLGGVFCVIGLGTLYKMVALSSGGSTVAELLGGSLIPAATTDPHERRVLNVVSEMAIASGVAVPPVYLLRGQEGINAFAAGYTPSDAIVAVTEGTMKYLTRDELQGVVAHEFSHIFNGDMRLNVRLMGVLNGILVIGLTGYWLMRSAGRSSGNRKSGAGLLLTGLGLFVVGYVGVFLANLIKAAVSRQREFLADASAVQFTRNPSGIAGALKKIAGLVQGSVIDTPRAQEASHFYFADGIQRAFLGLLSTHPPIGERIRRIDPAFSPSEIPLDVNIAPVQEEAAVSSLGAFASETRITPAEVEFRVGNPTEEHVAYAHSLLKVLSPRLLQETEAAFSARAVIYALLLHEGEQGAGLELLRAREGERFAELVSSLLPEVARLGPRTRLPLAELALPTLRTLSKQQYRTFKDTMLALIRADNRVTLREYALYYVVLKTLDDHFLPPKKIREQFTSLDEVLSSAMTAVTALAYITNRDLERAERACRSGLNQLRQDLVTRFVPPTDTAPLLSRLEGAMRTLSEASALVRLRVVQACVACIGEDGEITAEEGELIRAIGAALECPLPPLVLQQS